MELNTCFINVRMGQYLRELRSKSNAEVLEEEDEQEPGWSHPLYEVLQCYTAWPARTKLRFRVLQEVLQSATQGATFCERLRIPDEIWIIQPPFVGLEVPILRVFESSRVPVQKTNVRTVIVKICVDVVLLGHASLLAVIE